MINFVFVILPFALIATQLQMELRAPAAMLMDADTGAILYEKEGMKQIYPASVTKVATALFVLAEKKAFLDQSFTITSESLQRRPASGEYPAWWWYPDGARMWLMVGEKMPLSDLLYGLLVVSGNDAANAIAEGIAGSVPQFMEELNVYLHKIGCLHTQFLNPHGCHHLQHWTTPYDLCLMMKEAVRHETFRKISTTHSYVRPKTNKQKALVLKNGNKLLEEKSHFYYPKVLAAKTGYHKMSQYVLLAAAEDQGRRLIGCVAGCLHNQDRYEEMIKMFETAFQEQVERRFLFGENHLFARNVVGGKNGLEARLSEDLWLHYYPSQESEIRAFVSWKSLELPILKGVSVGEVQIVDATGNILQRGELFARNRVDGTLLHRWMRFWRSAILWK